MATHAATARRTGGLLAAVATASIIILVFVASISLRPWPDALFATDFVAFWTGGSLVREGAGSGLFDMERQHHFQVELRLEQATATAIRNAPGFDPYHNPPPLALLFVPLTLLPIPWAYLLWSAISLTAIVLAVVLPLRGSSNRFAAAGMMLALAPVGETLLQGRVDGAFLLAFSLALLALSSDRPFLGGAVLGLLWLKPQYALLFPLVFAVKRRWLELAGMASTGLILCALSLAMIGFDGLDLYLQELRRMGAFYPPASSVVNAPIMINWRAVLIRAWPGIPEVVGNALVLALGASTALASLAAWRGKWDPASPRFARQMLVTAMAIVITATHSHFNGMVLLLAPLALAVAKPMGSWSDRQTWELGRPPNAALARVHFASAACSTWTQLLWTVLLGVGYLLGLILWVLLDLRWLMLPYFLLAMALLTYEVWRDPSY